MLHLRVIAPTELRESVIGVLRRDKGVTHVVVHRDAALDPLGDEVTADIAREAANDVIDDLKALGLKRRGAITLDVVDTVVSTAAYRAEQGGRGRSGRRGDLGRARRQDPGRVVAERQLTDVSVAGLSDRRRRRGDGLAGHGRRRDGGRPEVGPLSLVVALFAGAAGMLSLVSAKSSALVGVFISVTTVPAAGFAVVAATVGDWDIAAKSATQLGVNLAGIVLAGVLVLWVYLRLTSHHRAVRRT